MTEYDNMTKLLLTSSKSPTIYWYVAVLAVVLVVIVVVLLANLQVTTYLFTTNSVTTCALELD